VDILTYFTSYEKQQMSYLNSTV